MFGNATLGRESAPGSQGQGPGSFQPAELLPTPLWAERSPPACGGAGAEADLCLLLSIRIWDGKKEGLHPATPLWPLGRGFHLWQEEGAEGGAGKCLVRGGENSAVALAKEQKSPPFPLLCSCCPASSCFNHWVMAPPYIQFCYPNVLSGHIVLISVNSLHPTSIICLRASLNYASNHSDFREDTVTQVFLFSCWSDFFVDPISSMDSTVSSWLFPEGRRLLTEIATLQLCFVVFYFFFSLKLYY